jgi:hypothetical protein
MVDINSELEKSFWFYIIDDYRIGRKIYTYTHPPKYENEEEEQSEEEDNAPEEACEIKFFLPKEGKRIYIVNEFPKYETIWHKDINNENTETLYLKIFSQIHDCMPFEVSGYNCAYKEEGHYPDISDEIKILPNIISKKLVKKITHCEDNGYYFLFIVDSNGIDFDTYLLYPV